MSGLLKTEIQSRKYIYNLIYILRFQIALVLFASMNRVGSNCRVYKGGKTIPADPNLDYAANYAHMLGYKDQKFHELMRLYITIHRSIFKICIQYSSCEM
jgi:citrate synthase